MKISTEAYTAVIVGIDADSSPVRRMRESEAVARALAELCGPQARKVNDSIGAPHLEIDGKPQEISISVSHSRDYAAVAVSPFGLFGLDIEQMRGQLEKVAHRVLSPEEFDDYSRLEQGLLRAWTLKEALYKACRSYAGVEIDFAEQLHLPLGEENKAVFTHPNIEGAISLQCDVHRVDSDTLLSVVWGARPLPSAKN